MKTNRIIPFFVLLFAFFLNAELLFSESERREWTSNGVTVIGAWDPPRDTAEDRITLESSDGSQRTLSLKDLSDEDRAYVEAKRKETGWEPMPDPGAQNIYALLVGVTDYANYDPLKYAVNDMKELQKRLLEMNVPAGNITMLISGAGKRQEPSKSNIERELNGLLGSADGGEDRAPRVKKGDVVFIALSGHGTQTPNGAYFMPDDVSERSSEIESTSISIDALQTRMNGSPATFKWLLVDACRSQPPRLLGHEGERNSADYTLSKLQTISAPPAGMVTMQSCSANESSWESESLKQGIFTSTFIDGLKGGADLNGDGSLTMLELTTYLSKETPRRVRSEKPQESQTPYMSTQFNDFIIVDGLLRDGLSPDIWNEADGYFQQACLFRRQRQYRKAQNEIRRALKLTEGASAGSSERQKYEDERDGITRDLEQESKTLYRESESLCAQGKYDEALQKIGEALALDPEKQEYKDFKARIPKLKEGNDHYNAYRQLLKSQDYSGAKEEIEKALSFAPENSVYKDQLELVTGLVNNPPSPQPVSEEQTASTDTPAGRVSNLGLGTQAGEKKTITAKGIDYTFCWCPAGSFTMGSPKSEEGRYNDETEHRVTLTHGFWLLESEVTQEMWESVMGTTVRQQRDKGDKSWLLVGVGSHYPMYYVNWDESEEFCRKLSALTGENVQLPTEAQWEYACRAGSKTALYTGDIKILGESNAPALDKIAWYGGNSGEGYSGGEVDEGADSSDWEEKQYDSSPSGTHEVKGKEPNAWGLYDMIGNVKEWCSDWWKDEYPSGTVTDPAGPSSGSLRVFRGGSWSGYARICRSARRFRNSPSNRLNYLGFRLVVVSAD